MAFAREISAHIGSLCYADQTALDECSGKLFPVFFGADQACGLEMISGFVEDLAYVFARQGLDQDIAHHGR